MYKKTTAKIIKMSMANSSFIPCRRINFLSRSRLHRTPSSLLLNALKSRRGISFQCWLCEQYFRFHKPEINPMDSNESYEFPVTSTVTTTEHDFLHLHTPEAVFNMINDGSYSKLSAFLNITDLPSKEDDIVARELFRKELTKTDVGQRKGLLIPMKDTEEFFPEVKKAEEAKGVLLRFLDRKTNQWLDFRYYFYKSSQSYVLTTGWSKYVKANFLREKDVIKFYECMKSNTGECEERDVMIDVVKWGEGEREIEIEAMEIDHGEAYNREKGVCPFGVLIG